MAQPDSNKSLESWIWDAACIAAHNQKQPVSFGAGVRSRARSCEIPSLTYAIKH